MDGFFKLNRGMAQVFYDGTMSAQWMIWDKATFLFCFLFLLSQINMSCETRLLPRTYVRDNSLVQRCDTY